MSLELVEIYPVLFEHLDRFRVVALDLEVPFKVELPSVDWTWLPPFLIEKRYSELYDFHFVDGSLDCTVLTLLFRTVFKVKF